MSSFSKAQYFHYWSFWSGEERINTLEARVAESCAMVEQVFRERRAREQEIQEREQRQREERERALIERERRQREEQERIARDQEERENLSDERDRRQGNSEVGPREATSSVDDVKYLAKSPLSGCVNTTSVAAIYGFSVVMCKAGERRGWTRRSNCSDYRLSSIDDEKYPVQEFPQWLCEHYTGRFNLSGFSVVSCGCTCGCLGGGACAVRVCGIL